MTSATLPFVAASLKKILFHHIPKTAGTSLIESAQAALGDAVCPSRYEHQISDDQILDDKLVFYHGHFTRAFVLRFRFLVPDAIIFTFVRHPFSRLLSQFYNWTDRARVVRELAIIAATSGETAHLRDLRAKFEQKILHMSLTEFLESSDHDVLQATDNLQCQYMTLFEPKPNHQRFSLAPVNAAGFYDFIGLQELFEPCLRIVEAKCGLPIGTFGGSTRANVSDYAKSSGRYQVTASEMALLERRNVYDLALFHAVYVLLLKLYADWLPPYAADLDSFIDLPEVRYLQSTPIGVLDPLGLDGPADGVA